MTSQAFFSPPPSSLLKITSSKSKTLSLLTPQTRFLESTKILKKTQNSTPSSHIDRAVNGRVIKSSASDSFSTTTLDNPNSSNTPISPTNDQNGEEFAAASAARIGARVRVKGPLTVYHIPKVPEFDLSGKIGTLKQYVGVHKGKPISANYPFKVEFVEDNIEGRDGPVKFAAHLREDEFEYID